MRIHAQPKTLADLRHYFGHPFARRCPTMTASPSKADADAERFVLDEPPADMGREGAYDVQEAREKKADAAAGGKFLVLEFWYEDITTRSNRTLTDSVRGADGSVLVGGQWPLLRVANGRCIGFCWSIYYCLVPSRR